MNLKEQFKRIGGYRLSEADVFSGGGEETTEEPKSNMAVKKFDMVLKGKPQWDKVKEIAADMNEIKKADFIMYLMDDIGMDDKAKSKLKLKL
tara:strand:+ start:825 stop:1100 length:276 start_codon:yes stop_codon:yes gene_type:complete